FEEARRALGDPEPTEVGAAPEGVQLRAVAEARARFEAASARAAGARAEGAPDAEALGAAALRAAEALVAARTAALRPGAPPPAPPRPAPRDPAPRSRRPTSSATAPARCSTASRASTASHNARRCRGWSGSPRTPPSRRITAPAGPVATGTRWWRGSPPSSG